MGGKHVAVDRRPEIVAVEQRIARARQGPLRRFDRLLQALQRQRL